MKFTIEKKMMTGYLPVILLILVIAVLSTKKLNELNTINRSIINEDTFLIQATEKMEDAILAQESYGRRYLILGDKKMLDFFWNRNLEFNGLADKVRALQLQDIPIDQLVSAHNDFNALYTSPDILPGKYSELASGKFDELLKNQYDKMIAYLLQMRQLGKQNQFVKMEKANTIGIKYFRITALLSTLGIILGLAVVSIITRSISRAIKELKRATEIISEGKYDYKLQIDTNDELGDLASSLRVMALRLSLLEKISLDTSPLTKMPGGMAIENILTKRLEVGRNLAFCLLDLDNFKAYNDKYGYSKGNEVIKTTAEIIKTTVAQYGSKEDFVGHIGGDDFAIVTDVNKSEIICKTVIKRFDENISNYYDQKDREQGYIVAKNRQGQRVKQPIMTISIAIVSNDQEEQINHIRIGEIAAELKEYAKTLPGSVFVTDRRGKYPEPKEKKIKKLKLIHNRKSSQQ